MILNLLVLPLAAGYFLLTRSYHFKFKQQRLDRQRLLFETVIVAVFILVGGFLLKTFVYDVVFNEELRNAINNLNPLKNTPYSGTVLISFVLTIMLVMISNLLLDKKKEIYRAIKDIGNEFELLASRSFKENRLSLISLKNDKFYIGWVKELPIPSQSNYLRIIPALSGYRNEKKNLEFTSHYLTAYARFIEDGKGTDVSDLETDVIISICEIVSISFYDQDIFDVLNP
ncbi:MAG: hypothetical protein LBJ04_22635 [Sphingobacterium sp.]|jgi:hypothetical protein|nr:hypothetical protein [Sphingobacterium sp.]